MSRVSFPADLRRRVDRIALSGFRRFDCGIHGICLAAAPRIAHKGGDLRLRQSQSWLSCSAIGWVASRWASEQLSADYLFWPALSRSPVCVRKPPLVARKMRHKFNEKAVSGELAVLTRSFRTYVTIRPIGRTQFSGRRSIIMPDFQTRFHQNTVAAGAVASIGGLPLHAERVSASRSGHAG